MKSPIHALVLTFSLILTVALPSFAQADAEGPVSRRPIAQCYNPTASNRPGEGSILKLKLDMLRTRSGSQIIAGLGVDMIPASSSAGFPAIFTTGGTVSSSVGNVSGNQFGFERGGSYKYLDVESQPLVVRAITLDRRSSTVTIEIAPGFNGRALVAKGCRFF